MNYNDLGDNVADEGKTTKDWLSELPALTSCDNRSCCSREITSPIRRKKTAELRKRWLHSRSASLSAASFPSNKSSAETSTFLPTFRNILGKLNASLACSDEPLISFTPAYGTIGRIETNSLKKSDDKPLKHLSPSWLESQWNRQEIHKRPDFTFPVKLNTPEMLPQSRSRDYNPRLAPMFRSTRPDKKITYLIDKDWLSERNQFSFIDNKPVVDSAFKRSVTFAN